MQKTCLKNGGEYDIVYSNGVLHHTPNMSKSFNEAYRVLKDKGEFYVILYHKNSIFYWFSLFFVKHILLFGFLKMSFKDRLSKIEFTTSEDLPLVNVYSRQEVKKIMEEVGFSVESIDVRKLVKEDMPYLPILRSIWKSIPQGVYDKIGKYFGWYIIVKGIKRIDK
jgi:ubiquinone/menaquinone biosynthesis C-methylase UbiE